MLHFGERMGKLGCIINYSGAAEKDLSQAEKILTDVKKEKIRIHSRILDTGNTLEHVE